MEHKTENMVYKKIRRTMKKTLQKFLSLLLVVVFSVSLSGCFKEKETPYTVSLEMWGVFDETDAYRDIIGPYLRMNPHVKTIEYRKMAVDTYERDLLDALAAGNGPDIFMIRNVWLPSFANKLAPADSAFVSEKDYRDAFVDVTADDFFSEGKAYAVPLSVDSLGLYYNKDILNAAGISSPPKTWQEVLRDIRPLSRIDEYGTIIQSALAMGTAYNVNRSTDLLSLIFLQFGVSANGFGQNQADFGNQGLLLFKNCCSMLRSDCFFRCFGKMSVRLCPTASFCVHPKVCCACTFQPVISQSEFIDKKAS
jgi:ABC-type glycerol-3-phosphate transport system substrate-binding protein